MKSRNPAATSSASLEQLTHLVETRWPDYRLNPPAKASAFTALEKTLGAPVPPELRGLYQWHDGQHPLERSFLGNYDWLGLRGAQSNLQLMNKLLADGVFDEWAQDEWWNPRKRSNARTTPSAQGLVHVTMQ